MKISELIAKLEAIKAEHGDKAVFVHDEGGYYAETHGADMEGLQTIVGGLFNGMVYQPLENEPATSFGVLVF